MTDIAKPEVARNTIETNIANDPLWAAQVIIDHGSKKLIALLCQIETARRALEPKP